MAAYMCLVVALCGVGLAGSTAVPHPARERRAPHPVPIMQGELGEAWIWSIYEDACGVLGPARSPVTSYWGFFKLGSW